MKKPIIFGMICIGLIVAITNFFYNERRTIANDHIETEYEFIAENPLHELVDKKKEKKLKEKVKKPKKLPDDFEVDQIRERISNLGDTIFEYTYVSKNKKMIILTVSPEPSILNFSNDFGESPKKIILKNGTEATFFKNDGSSSLYWTDKETNYQYSIHIMRDKQISRSELNNENSSKGIQKLKLIAESIQ